VSISERLREAADRVAKRAMGHDAQALISIPRQPYDVDAIATEAADVIDTLADALTLFVKYGHYESGGVYVVRVVDQHFHDARAAIAALNACRGATGTYWRDALDGASAAGRAAGLREAAAVVRPRSRYAAEDILALIDAGSQTEASDG
jgi:hypothetical protein